MSIQELEVLLEQHAALFYHLHHREAVERLKRQTLREELARVLGAMGKAQAGIQTRCTCNMLSALSVRSASLRHEITSSSAQLVDLMEQAELAEDCYEDVLYQLEALMNMDAAPLGNGLNKGLKRIRWQGRWGHPQKGTESLAKPDPEVLVARLR